ncbi:MAG: hypothetical protein K8S54_16505 [Spirochaetia bacterium]|nr:hypothetical protein [Spirochaetia bacterium]
MKKLTLFVSFMIAGMLAADPAMQPAALTYKKFSGAGFTIDAPTTWAQNSSPSVALELASPDEVANYRVIVQDRAGKSSDEILIAMEEQLSYENMLDPPQRKLKPSMLKPMAAEDCTVGAYSVEKNGISLNQRIWVLVKGTKAFVLVETTPDDNLGDYIDAFDHISKSIRLK